MTRIFMLPIHRKLSDDCQSDSCDCASESETDNRPEFSRRGFIVSAGVLAAGLSAGPVLAANFQESYADAIMADDSLRGYWRFDGDLVDAKKKAPATSKGPASFAAGVVDGKALLLTPRKSVTVEKTDHLRGRSATVEFFFKLDTAPQGKQHVVLISQTNGPQVRYIVGVKNDLSGLIYQNAIETVQTTINLPTDQPIEIGRWYHFAMTSFDLDLRAYVDGYECSLTGGAFEFTRRGPKKSSMMLGGTSAKGWDEVETTLDEVACYARGLAESEFQDHLRAAGWGERLAETGRIVARVEEARNANRAAKAESILNDPALTAPGESRVYEGEHLEAINFIVGGIGAGGIQFDGRAQPAIWQIACNYREVKIADSFLAVRVQSEQGQPVVRALQTEAVGSFAAMPSLKFVGEYPFANYRFEEPALPVKVELEVFNPFIPMDLKNCAIPCAIYNVKLTNPSASKVSVDVLAAQQNAIGYHEGKGGSAKFGNNVNQIVTAGDATLLHMTRKGDDSADMVLMSQESGATGCAVWDENRSLHESFAAKGVCDGPQESDVSPNGETVSGALTAPVELAPGETKTVTFVLAWYFKNGKHGSGKKPVKLEGEAISTVGWSHSGQNYTNWWGNAREVATYLQENLDDLVERSRRFHDTLYASNLPVWLLDRCSSQLAVLRSQTCWWAADGYFGFWEGCNPNKGCCGGNCGHVWQYAQAHARLLPELGRLIRQQDFDTQRPDGLIPNRHTSEKEAAADGFFANILNTYREHLCSVDDTWIKSVWPHVKKAMDWGIHHWDPNRDGYMQNTQHNTLDGAFTGCSSWIGTIYLAALEAAARMAEIAGDDKLAADYRTIRESGRKLQNDRLWNGEYYIQKVGKKREQDYLDGCHIDQLLGEWWADQVGIDPAYPADRSRTAMESLLKHNFLADFQGQSLKPRQYCESTDGGMKMITWPKNPQPIPGMKYGDEVMTGFEYGAAVTLMQNGMLREGLMAIKIISDRYDGRLRTKGVSDFANGPWGYSGNPFGDDECGKFYGRSLSVWSALTALQGFHYDGPKARIGFKPRINEDDHVSFFTAAKGYGLFRQVRKAGKLNALIEVAEGEVRVMEIVLSPGDKQPQTVQVFTGRKEARVGGEVDFEVKDGGVHVRLPEPVMLLAGQSLEVEIS